MGKCKTAEPLELGLELAAKQEEVRKDERHN